jgi:hypothetical protein
LINFFKNTNGGGGGNIVSVLTQALRNCQNVQQRFFAIAAMEQDKHDRFH